MELIPGFERYKKLQKLAEIGLEGTPLKPFFRYAKIKGDVLFFVFNHPNAKLEFKYKKEQIKGNMRGFYKENLHELKSLKIVFRDVAAVFVQEQERRKTDKTNASKTPVYTERARGTFETKCSDKRLEELFLEAKKMVKEKQ